MSRLANIEACYCEQKKELKDLAASLTGFVTKAQVLACFDTKTIRAVIFHAEIEPNGTVGDILVNIYGLTATGGQTPGTGNDSAGNDYQITFSNLPADASADVIVTGDVLDQGTAGTNDNAYTPQNVGISGNTLTYTLYSGDDGGGTDDAKDRANEIQIFANCDVLTLAN